MDKIRNLLEKCGLSAEVANNICEAIQGHANALREPLEAEYTKRTEAAKRICVEETEQHKLELARRLQVFCEAKAAQIEQIMARQAQAREGQAVSTLEQMKSLLEGVSISDDSGLKQEVLSLKEQVQKLASERDQAIQKANRQTQLAEKVLRRNRLVEGRLATIESGATEDHTILGEGVAAKALEKKQGGTQRLDGSRRTGQPTTTRRTIAESQDRKEAIDERAGSNVRTGMMNNALSPAQIAEGMEEGPPV